MNDVLCSICKEIIKSSCDRCIGVPIRDRIHVSASSKPNARRRKRHSAIVKLKKLGLIETPEKELFPTIRALERSIARNPKRKVPAKYDTTENKFKPRGRKTTKK